jgi:hypothetical protein
MKKIFKDFCMILIGAFFLANISVAQNINNSFLFDGFNSIASIKDGAPVNTDANQTGFQYFNKTGSTNNQITVEAWVYIIGENLGKKMPIIYRAVMAALLFHYMSRIGKHIFLSAAVLK